MCVTLPGFEPDVDVFRLDFEAAAHSAVQSVGWSVLLIREKCQLSHYLR